MTQRALDIISGKDPRITASALRCAMTLATPVYALANGIRNRLFDAGLKNQTPLGRPTISVGNLTTGGTGKTPMVAHIVRTLLTMNHRPAILLRGYKATAQHGSDEAAVYNTELGDRVPVIANPSRVEGAKQALIKVPGVTCFVLDDGFQHRKAARDLDLVLIDASNPFGYDHLLPRGLMREPKSALKRADAIIITRSNQIPPESLAKLDQQILAITGKSPIAHASHQWISLLNINDDPCDLALLADQPVIAAIAIGNPDAFVQTLREYASEVRDVIIKPDHHAWPPQVIHALVKRARSENTILLTTEKDFVKWPTLEPSAPVYRVNLEMGFKDGSENLNTLIQNTTPQAR
ncbi:tetraacyldisaccharide 4'-kinase [bacterium AH-315-I18]|nr:tetraacyldisaccharide 4'-kinase [bacterium AH-315-I18]